MSAPELSAEEAAIVARFDAAPVPAEVLLSHLESVRAALASPAPATQEPACHWAHGPVTGLDSRGLCQVCAEDEL